MGETAFIMYAVIYLILGILAMLISMFIIKKEAAIIFNFQLHCFLVL